MHTVMLREGKTDVYDVVFISPGVKNIVMSTDDPGEAERKCSHLNGGMPADLQVVVNDLAGVWKDEYRFFLQAITEGVERIKDDVCHGKRN